MGSGMGMIIDGSVIDEGLPECYVMG